MQNQERKGTFRRFASSFKGRNTSPTTAAMSSQRQPSNDGYDDHRRTRMGYDQAATELNEAVRRCAGLGSFDFEVVGDDPQGLDDFQLKNKINQILIARETSIKDRGGWTKFTDAVECVFTALSPLAKTILLATKNAQPIADREIARKAKIAKTLDELCKQLGELDVVTILPDDFERRDIVINRAIDVRTACMQYLTSHIQHEATPMGIAGKMAKSIMGGETRLANAVSHLKSAIDSYNSALNNINLRIVIKVYEVLKGMANLQTQDETEQLPMDNFVVPYERNPWFTGRKKFLEKVKEKLLDRAPRKHNHRVALYGMGGIGKTQSALEYVYSNRESYERIYWITAVDEASLLSGYRKIAMKAGLKNLLNLKPDTLAEGVVSWLRQEQNWLLVIDNLDDITVAAGYLPQNGPLQHTLITTRNPNSTGIPAEGLEVPLLDSSDSIDLLSVISNIDIMENSPENEQAQQIVEELGYLPLAIEQAGAYVKEVAGDFATFLDHYGTSRKDVHQWIPQGNRSHWHSVATTWSMSFKIVRSSDPQAAELLQLLSFLNPDGILIDFLQDGIEALQGPLRQVVSNKINLSKALIELEKFSLIKWNRRTKTLRIHRLVQTVITDEMSDTESMKLRATIINLCDRSFPQQWHNENREVCRLYVSQAMKPILDVKVIRTETSTRIMYRIGWFLRHDGKTNDSARVSLQAAELSAEVLGKNNPFTLNTMDNLALAYRAQGMIGEAARLHEEVLEKRKRILGDNHPDTLTTMNNLALSHLDLGRMGQATRLHEEVLERSNHILDDDPDALVNMNNLTSSYHWQAQGKTREAARLHEEWLKKNMGIHDEHFNMSTITGSSASSYQAQGRTGKAAGPQEEEPDESKRLLRNDHPNMLTIKSNLAMSYWADGRPEDATKLHEEVLEKRKRVLGDDHPDTLTNMDNLALSYSDQGRTEDAARLHEEALKKIKRILGDDHPDTLTTTNNLALAYSRLGRPEEGARLHEEVLEKRKRLLRQDHPDTLTTMNNLALSYSDQGRIEEASRLFEEVLEKRTRTLGDHLDTLMTMNNLANSYLDQGRTEEAARLHEEVLEKRKRILGDDHPDTLTTMDNLVLTYSHQRRTEDMARLHEEVRERRKRIIGDNSGMDLRGFDSKDIHSSDVK